jgi:phytoene dehydrogenase-like protein
MTRVAIIGAGLAGLTCAHYLDKAGVPFKVFEKESVAGGRIKQVWIEGVRLNVGGALYTMDYKELRNLITEYNLLDDEIPTNYKDGAVYMQGNIIRFGVKNLLLTPHFSSRTKLKLYSLFRFLRTLDVNHIPQKWHDILVKDFIEKRFSREVLEIFIEPGMRGFLAKSSEEVSAYYGIKPLANFFHERLLKGGLFQLIARMMERLEKNVSLDDTVQNREVTSAGNFRIKSARGDEEFDVAVCTMPPTQARRLIPDLPDSNLRYSRRRLLILKGQRKFEGGLVLNADWQQHNVYLIGARGEFTTASVGMQNYDLSPFMENYEVLHEEIWTDCGPIMPPGSTTPPIESGIRNLYLCGDFYEGGELESAAKCGRIVAETISHSQTSQVMR